MAEEALEATLSRLISPVREISRLPGAVGRRVYLAKFDCDRTFVVKQPSSHGLESHSECWFYESVRPCFDHAPSPRLVKSDQGLIVLEFLEDAVTVQTISRRSPSTALGALLRLAPVLRALHTTPPASTDNPDFGNVMPPLDPVPVELWDRCSDGARMVVRHVQRRPVLARHYAEARQQMRAGASIVHGDIKLDNVLWSAQGPRLVDWELSGLGSPLVDIGATIGSMVGLWIDGLSIDASSPIDAWLLGGELHWTAVQDAVDTFFASYGDGVEHGGFTRVSAVRAAAAWMVGRAWADASLTHAASPQVLLRLVVANSLVNDPALLARSACA